MHSGNITDRPGIGGLTAEIGQLARQERTLEIDLLMLTLSAKVDAVMKRTSALAERLHPVLTPSLPAQGNTDKRVSAATPLGSTLSSRIDELDNVHAVLQDVMDRLEV